MATMMSTEQTLCFMVTSAMAIVSTVLALVAAMKAVGATDNTEHLREIAQSAAETALTLKRLHDGDGDHDQPQRKRTYIAYNHARAAYCVNEDYWGPNPIFNDRQFERVFRVTRAMADRILLAAASSDEFFHRKEDALGRPGICPKVKILMGLKCLAYGVSPSAFMDYFQMGETTGHECVKRLAKSIANDDQLLTDFRCPMNRSDARQLSELHMGQHGVEGMIGLLDCMHVGWRTCPIAWQGAYKGAKGKPTIILEALIDHNLWFWHVSFGGAGSLNDINVWDRSPLLKTFVDGSFSRLVDFDFRIGGQTFSQLWLMVDGIYPQLARFVKTISSPVGRRESIFTSWQEASRKDVERGFGVLQQKFHVLVQPFELWFTSDIKNIVNACITLHNMMVKERMNRLEDEAIDWYQYAETEDDAAMPDAIQDQVQRHREELDLHMNLEAQLQQGPTVSLARQMRLNSTLLSQLQQATQLRWQRLYNPEEHFRL